MCARLRVRVVDDFLVVLPVAGGRCCEVFIFISFPAKSLLGGNQRIIELWNCAVCVCVCVLR